MNEKLQDWLILLRAPTLGAVTAHRLLQQHDYDLTRALNSSDAELSRLGIKPQALEFFANNDQSLIEPDLRWAEQPGHHIIPCTHPDYPQRLRQLPQAPLLLYVRGDPEFLNQPQLAMVGSRNPTAAGARTATDFATYLSRAGITITSGLARGIDAACHKGALHGVAGTIALVAHGLDIVYPAAHKKLAAEIAADGAVVSEMPVGTEPNRGLFPRRNRIISGMTMGTLVVEAALKSGSLITAKHALEQGREIFAIPGSIHNPLSRGCHQLIRQGAKLVETADDILEELAHAFPTRTDSKISQKPDKDSTLSTPALDPDHQKLLKCLQFEPAAIDELVESSGFSAAEIASMLLIMELEGSVVCDNGRYTRIA